MATRQRRIYLCEVYTCQNETAVPQQINFVQAKSSYQVDGSILGTGWQKQRTFVHLMAEILHKFKSNGYLSYEIHPAHSQSISVCPHAFIHPQTEFKKAPTCSTEVVDVVVTLWPWKQISLSASNLGKICRKLWSQK